MNTVTLVTKIRKTKILILLVYFQKNYASIYLFFYSNYKSKNYTTWGKMYNGTYRMSY